jgi:hypothetical protein
MTSFSTTNCGLGFSLHNGRLVILVLQHCDTIEALGATASIIAILELCIKVAECISVAKGCRNDRLRLKAEILMCQEPLKGLEEETKVSDNKNSRSVTFEALKGAGGRCGPQYPRR